MNWQSVKKRFLSHKLDYALIAIAALAAAVRCYWPGAFQFVWDEVQIHYNALFLARHGQWVWLGNPSSWDALPAHSPFSTYLIALPYLFFTDAQAARTFVGLLGVLAVAVIYMLLRRYYGQSTAVMGGLLLAVGATAVYWSRFVWNPNVAQVFFALWILTGLMGYYEGKRWAQAAHWLALSAALQSQASYGVIAVLSLLLVVYGWFYSPSGRRTLVTHTLMGWGLAGLSLVPWIIGLASTGFSPTGAVVERTWSFNNPFAGEMLRIYLSVIGSTDYWTIARFSASPGNWWPSPNLSEPILSLQGYAMLLGAVGLLVSGLRGLQKNFPAIFLSLVTLWAPAAFSFIPHDQGVTDFYLMPGLFGAFPVLAILLSKVWRIRPYGRWLSIAVAGAIVVLQLWLVVATLRWLDVDGTREAFRAPMTVHQRLLDDWIDEGGEVVILTETKEAKYGATEQAYLWTVLGEGKPVRIVGMPQGIPFARDGQILASPMKGATIPALFGEGQTAGQLWNGDPIFRWVKVSPDSLPAPTLLPQGSGRFNNGARLLGFHAVDAPQAGKTWSVKLLWTPERSLIDQQYQFSIRLIDDAGNRYAQVDLPSMAGGLWRAGDTVLNLVDIPVAENLPANISLSVQVLMYTWPEIVNADVVDEAGRPVGQWVLFRVGMLIE